MDIPVSTAHTFRAA